jgi:phosphoribosylformylglycinamidine synthase
MVKVGVLFTAGTNCDEETIIAFQYAGARADRLYLNELKKKPERLLSYEILCIPGGFSYGDYIGAGKILANFLKSLLKDVLIEFFNQRKLILGICNGFQVLVKTGLLPEFSFTQTVTLTTNDSNRFECRWVYLKVNPQTPCIFTQGLDFIALPIAHAEGKFTVDRKETLDKILKRNQMVLVYTDKDGEPSGYPDNPNGSIYNIAGICDPTGRVFGLMPHPERASFLYQYPLFLRPCNNEPEGLRIFKNAVKYAEENLV